MKTTSFPFASRIMRLVCAQNARATLLLAPCSLLFACSAIPARTTLHYSPPSVMPVRTAISTAQDHAAKVKSALQIVGQALSLADPKVRQPGMVALQTANTELDALTASLLKGDSAAVVVQNQTNTQTDQLNTANEQKNLAITRAEEAGSRYHKLKFYACLLGAGVALLAALKFGGFIPPPYNFAVMAGLPALVFGALWLRL